MSGGDARLPACLRATFRATTRASLVCMLACAALAEEPSSASQRAALIARLDLLPHAWAELGLAAEIELPTGTPGSPLRAAISETLRLRVRTLRDAHLVVLMVDGHGVLSVVRNTPTAKTGPAGAALLSFVVAPPLGATDLVVLATRRPLAGSLAEGPSSRAPTVLSPAQGESFLADLARQLDEFAPGDIALSRARFEVAGRSALRGTRIARDDASVGVEYTSEDVVAYFSSQRARVVGSVRLDLHVRFAPGSDALNDGARESLDVVGRALQNARLRDLEFRVGGHTDDVGVDAYNLALSRRRAEAARAYLIDEWGVEPERLEVVAYGEAAPLELGTSESVRAMNRRVDFERLAAPREAESD